MISRKIINFQGCDLELLADRAAVTTVLETSYCRPPVIPPGKIQASLYFTRADLLEACVINKTDECVIITCLDEALSLLDARRVISRAIPLILDRGPSKNVDD